MIKHWFSDVRAFRHNPLDLIVEKGTATVDPFIKLSLGPRPVWLVRDPALVKPLMNLSEEVSDKGALVLKLRNALGRSTLTLSGEQHKARRAVLHERLSRGVATTYVPEMIASIRATCLTVIGEGSFRADLVGGSLALRLICVALFGYRVLTPADEMIVMQSVNALEASLQADMFRFLPRTPWQKKKDDEARAKALQSISFIISKVRDAAVETSVLKALESLGLSDDEIRDEIATMIIAGYHTTGAAIAWVLHFLSKNAGVVQQLRLEYSRISNENAEPDAKKLSSATTSLAFVKEVLRLYPSAWWTTREIKQSTEVSGKSIKKGTTLIFSPWLYHRDARNFENPQEFSLNRTYSSVAYLPFGVGPRACVGMGVALLELQLIALECAASLDLRSSYSQSAPTISPGITLSAPQFHLNAFVRGQYDDINVEAA